MHIYIYNIIIYKDMFEYAIEFKLMNYLYKYSKLFRYYKSQQNVYLYMYIDIYKYKYIIKMFYK